MNWLHDERIDCFSSIVSLPIQKYLSLVSEVHDKQGGIGGQRDVLKTTTGKRIRERMVKDIRAGAVLPPVVVGIVMAPAALKKIVDSHDLTIEQFAAALKGKPLSIIDGNKIVDRLHRCAFIPIHHARFTARYLIRT